ncbi:MAG: flagella basal body P-ring formation protein FlgA [Candidatus Riflebacteria bacterium]|nr:flagella basal body P-ring formation protein FlgA [Candidatus Riflebacteria bacterium]
MRISVCKSVIAIIALSAFCSIQTEASVLLKSSVLVTDGQINGDSLVSSNVESHLKSELASIQLGYIPDPLGTLTLDKKTLEKKLSEVSGDFEIPEKVTIKRTGTILKAAEIVKEIQRHCLAGDDENVVVDVSKVPATMVLPGNLLSYCVETSAQNNLGMKLFTLKADTDGGPFRQIIQVAVTKNVEVAKLTRLAKAGEVITPDMIIKDRIEIKSDKSNLPISYKNVLGKTLEHFKSAGTIIRESDLNNKVKSNSRVVAQSEMSPVKDISDEIKENIINPGDSVEYCVNAGSLRLKIPAKAVDGGNPGDEINLINLQNKKRIRGVITEKGVVEYAQK